MYGFIFVFIAYFEVREFIKAKAHIKKVGIFEFWPVGRGIPELFFVPEL